MTKSFSKREKVLLLVLVAILLSAIYYFFVALPSMDAISVANTQTATLQDEIMMETARLKKIKEMEKKIEEASTADGFKTQIPNYDNLEKVMKQMDSILSATTEYKLAFAPITEEDSLVYRPIEAEFNCANYATAKNIIQQIYKSPFKSLIDNLSVDNVEYDDTNIVTSPVKVTMTVVFIEKKEK